MTLVEVADKTLKEFDSIVATYNYSTEGLKADPRLEAIASRNLQLTADPSSKDRELLNQYLELRREGNQHYKACRILGLDPRALKKRIAIDGAFADEVNAAEEEFLEELEQRYIDIARSGSEKALQDILKKRYGDRWADEPRRIQIEGKIEHELSSGPLTEQIAALEAILRERATLGSANILELPEGDSWEEN